uniref:Uncharacterized protein n=1 Tax=Coxiella burnetii TaxID=777 RepID=Q45955_COXBE|nr:unnamed protein product [Coxiella burnetii]
MHFFDKIKGSDFNQIKILTTHQSFCFKNIDLFPFVELVLGRNVTWINPLASSGSNGVAPSAYSNTFILPRNVSRTCVIAHPLNLPLALQTIFFQWLGFPAPSCVLFVPFVLWPLFVPDFSLCLLSWF